MTVMTNEEVWQCALRRGILRAFVVARKKIADDEANLVFICLALPGDRYGDAAREVIRSRLGPGRTYARWLVANHPEALVRYLEEPGAFREARLCWLDALIEEFSK